MSRPGILTAVSAGLLAVVLFAACTSSTSPGTAPTGSGTPSVAVSPVGTIRPGTPGSHIRIAITGGNAQYALGHTIYITKRGFLPLHLVAGINKPIVFVNATTGPQGIQFLNYGSPIGSGTIPAGGKWIWKPPTTASIIYQSTEPPHTRGYLQIQLVQPVTTST